MGFTTARVQSSLSALRVDSGSGTSVRVVERGGAPTGSVSLSWTVDEIVESYLCR